MFDFSQEILLPCRSPLLDILFIGKDHSWACRWSFRINKFSWIPLLSRAVSYGILPSTSLNQGRDPALCLISSFQYPKLRHLVVTAVKAASDFHIPHWLFLVPKYEVQEGTFLCWFPDHLCWKIVIKVLLNSPGLFAFHYIVPSADTRVWKLEVSSSYLENSTCVSSLTTCRYDCRPATAHRPPFPPCVPHAVSSSVQHFREALRCAVFPERVWTLSPYAWET